jgi:ATP-dependent DNA helicase PIF1
MLKLNEEQQTALEMLEDNHRCFLTGQAGVGKTTVVNEFMKNKPRWKFPVLASTGMAAILARGRTLHSFFGIGASEGGKEATIERAVNNDLVYSKLRYTEGILIDEVSMISAEVFDTIEEIARECRGSYEPWGGLKVVVVGDFHQLPPVNRDKRSEIWAFQSETWKRSKFTPVVLNKVMRADNNDFINVLNLIRRGVINEQVKCFMDEHVTKVSDDFDGPRLFGKKEAVDKYNLRRLEELPGPQYNIKTEYLGKESHVNAFKKHSPIPDVLSLRVGALVMVRINDREGKYVNGSLGHVVDVLDSFITIKLIHNDKLISFEKKEFSLLDDNGDPQVVACNFPLTLAYSVTIHKAQGATMDKLYVDLNDLWECGQCYVAMSRVRTPEGLFLKSWKPQSIKVDKRVTQFYEELSYGERPT